MAWTAGIDYTTANGVGMYGETKGSIISDLIGAWNERCDLAFYPSGADYKIVDGTDGWDGIGDAGWDAIDRMDSNIDLMIVEFVKHTDSGGVWDNQATIPMWTVAGIDTIAGYSRPAVPRGEVPLPTWFKWMYDALDNLRWTWKGKGVGISGNGSWRKTTNSSVSYADLVTKWAGLSWVSQIPAFARDLEKYAYVATIGASTIWYAWLEAPIYLATIHTNDLKFDADIYASTIKAFYLNYGDYDANGYNVYENAIGKVFNFTNQQAAGNSISLDTQSQSDDSVPNDPTASTNQVRGFQSEHVTSPPLYDFEAVIKYDVVGGLSYVS